MVGGWVVVRERRPGQVKDRRSEYWLGFLFRSRRQAAGPADHDVADGRHDHDQKQPPQWLDHPSVLFHVTAAGILRSKACGSVKSNFRQREQYTPAWRRTSRKSRAGRIRASLVGN